MVRASVDGAIDFTACDQSPQWWRGAFLKIRAVEDSIVLRFLELNAQRAIAVQGMVDINDPGYRQDYAIEAVERFKSSSMPWFGAADGQNAVSGRLSAVAEWYAVFGGNLPTNG